MTSTQLNQMANQIFAAWAEQNPRCRRGIICRRKPIAYWLLMLILPMFHSKMCNKFCRDLNQKILPHSKNIFPTVWSTICLKTPKF